MKILELEQRTGLDRATIRYYEREGLIAPTRGENGYRNYSEADADYLLKIRLLRQLGMSLWQIRQLQAGEEDFAEALSQQIDVLSTRIQENKRAQAVCRKMQSQGVTYGELDARYYLRLLEEPLPEERAAAKPFREPLPRETHPWRRFFARVLDLTLFTALIQFVLIVVLRVRPVPEATLNRLLRILYMGLMVPVEALLISRLGSTPGKWIFGIHLESREDRLLTWDEALSRSWSVYSKGMGFGIPYVELFRTAWSYGTLTGRSTRRFARYDEVEPPREMDWDEGVETTYSPVRGKWLALPLALILALGIFTGIDSIKPKYRGDQLTISQFAKNYNTAIATSGWHLDKLNEDGTVRIPDDGLESGSLTIYVDGTPEDAHAGFRYETEGGILTAVIYENSWRDLFHKNPVSDECFQAAVSILMARDGVWLEELKEFEELWNANLGKAEADFSYRGIRVRWSMAFENSQLGGVVVEPIDKEKTSRVSIHFRLDF